MVHEDRPGEFDLIFRYFAPLAGEGAFGLLDDAALLSPPKEGEKGGKGQIVVTQDAIAENVHFLSSDPAGSVVKKALRANLSDLIAKGATPFAYSLALGLPDEWNEDLVAAMAAALAEDQEEFAISLTGGDTFRSPGGLVLSITAFGTVPEGEYVSRLGAGVGDILLVSGTLGDAALGLLVAQGKYEAFVGHDWLVERYFVPAIQPAIVPVIRQFATASMDISDGLLGDAEKLCGASGVSGRIELAKVPLSPAATNMIAAHPDIARLPYTGGDDYQVLFTVKPSNAAAAMEAAENAGVVITAIGEIMSQQSKSLSVLEDGREVFIEKRSFSHF